MRGNERSAPQVGRFVSLSRLCYLPDYARLRGAGGEAECLSCLHWVVVDYLMQHARATFFRFWWEHKQILNFSRSTLSSVSTRVVLPWERRGGSGSVLVLTAGALSKQFLRCASLFFFPVDKLIAVTTTALLCAVCFLHTRLALCTYPRST